MLGGRVHWVDPATLSWKTGRGEEGVLDGPSEPDVRGGGGGVYKVTPVPLGPTTPT